jgi:hypothetical protein
MKDDELKAPKIYLPSSMWQEHVDNAYSYLKSGLKENDIDKFHFFLANFGTWKTYHGIEATTLIRDNMGFFLKRRYLQDNFFYKQLKMWKWFYNGLKPISALTYPTYGNQSGAFIDGVFVGVGSFFNEIYGTMLSELIRDIDHPLVAELGAGYGKLAYFTLRERNSFTFIDFDLPEVLCVAAYYLMNGYPQKRVLLYGEKDLVTVPLQDYDLIFMPAYEISKLGSSTIDLFMNKNSLGEMSMAATEDFITHISRATKRYFFHMNHEINRNVYDNNEYGLLGYEYPVPSDRFTLLFRYPDIGHLLYQGYLDLSMDIFLYLYGRKDSVV